RGEPAAARRGEPVVAPQPVVHDLFPVHVDQPVSPEAVECRVEGARPQPDPPLGDVGDLADDPVAVLAAVGERGEDQERRLLHRPDSHMTSIYRSSVYGKSTESGVGYRSRVTVAYHCAERRRTQRMSR